MKIDVELISTSENGLFSETDFELNSESLGKKIKVTLLVPAGELPSATRLVVFQDGQDFPALGLKETASVLLENKEIPPTLLVGVHANEDRKLEYGVASEADYANRGNRAKQYTNFVLGELLPWLKDDARTSLVEKKVIAGFSLGGLMALDIAWNHSEIFSKVGIFSGSLWWRRKALDQGYDREDRIMHSQIRTAPSLPKGLTFWFQTGTLDETADRDNDGVIDSIGDTLECIAELEKKGANWGTDITYLEVAGGEHTPSTWAKCMPDFLRWALNS